MQQGKVVIGRRLLTQPRRRELPRSTQTTYTQSTRSLDNKRRTKHTGTTGRPLHPYTLNTRTVDKLGWYNTTRRRGWRRLERERRRVVVGARARARVPSVVPREATTAPATPPRRPSTRRLVAKVVRRLVRAITRRPRRRVKPRRPAVRPGVEPAGFAWRHRIPR